ncbi:MAG TPA: hypothetical protein VKO20_06545, partial [Desulfosalsimonadaceae bacterium]|nr:hypothetical protein [Desulfosalsimonadaceae bacterium]
MAGSRRREDILAEAGDFEAAIWRSLESVSGEQGRYAIPASPYRRMDAGAVGSMVADYPLQLTAADDARIGRTLEFLLENCFYKGAFFQDMIHSGINIYLTLDIAQTLLRRGDTRFRELIRACADMASPTGQWPEAIHPITGGGCMGDGQHGWAAAEWVMMMRNLFVREEGCRLVLGEGIFPEWLRTGEMIGFGPTPTPWGFVSVDFTAEQRGLWVNLDIEQEKPERQPEATVLAVPGYQERRICGAVRESFFLESLHS